ncbi:DUF3757 domain-containing protein [Legionella cardiaca]|uniref:DUF3757 domain-containing protein n=1 Tax=Legionella cardiaca TaxID=1071983 RepID=A0ABY8ARN3_9GAMM|nr:DUF3757 domain-containing protein [Legionella cardiaca]WED41862.1 DUF3757 domain-containing protein [Legionella cardiaca]
MKKIITTYVIFASFTCQAAILTCPDPDTTSLKWGVIPEPWIKNPYSSNAVQGEEGTRFTRANILVAGLGRGVMCTYKNSLGDYSIWWPVKIKIPARSDYNWIETVGGFVCTQSVVDCKFNVAIEAIK